MKLIHTILFIIVVAGFIFLLGKGIDKKNALECVRWNDEMQQFDNYYLTDWQKEQCKSFGWDF